MKSHMLTTVISTAPSSAADVSEAFHANSSSKIKGADRPTLASLAEDDKLLKTLEPYTTYGNVHSFQFSLLGGKYPQNVFD